MAKKMKIEFDIQGMTCDSCARHVEHALKSLSGVGEAHVPGWDSGKATATVGEEVETEDLVAAVRAAGYQAIPKSRQPLEKQSESQHLAQANGGTAGDYDLMVVGGGSAGFAAAIKGSELGFHVALVESGTIGGTCVNFGCVPSKTLIRSMELHHLAGQARFRGVNIRQGQLDWAEIVAHKDELVAEMRQSKYVDVLAAYPNITLLSGRARLTGGNGVEIDGQAYAPGKIVLATGAHPWAAPIPGLEEAGYLTSTTAMELNTLPRSLIVLGANAVGLELAQTFARAGVNVTLLEIAPRTAPFEEEAISEALEGYLQEEGLQIVTGFSAHSVRREEGNHILEGIVNGQPASFTAEQLLVATGRRPNTAGLGLEEAGVTLGARGETLVDDTLRTYNPYIYAVGDVTGKDMFVYTAAYGGGLAAENALLQAGRVYNADYIARITFTDPQIASAGLTETQAIESGFMTKTSTLPMAHVPRALAARDTRGLIKLVADATTDQLLGAHILAPEAGEMIQITSMALQLKLKVADLRGMMFPYLTNSEGIKLAALSFEKDVALLSCCAG